MSYADKVFIDMCRDIIDNGVSTEGEKVRPKWEDGTYAYTMKKFCVVNRYVAQHPKEVFQYLRQYGYLQYIACLDPFDGSTFPHSLTAEDYTTF